MTRQNRVQPDGRIVQADWRGMFMGNRGILHDAAGRLGRARWRHKNWVCCVLKFKGRQRQIMAPNRYTELFFLDEACALAAGHRPCAECRRADYNRFRAAFGTGFDAGLSAPEMDALLHPARVDGQRRQVRHMARAEGLPDGSFILYNKLPALLHGTYLRQLGPIGYAPPDPRPRGRVTVLTPAPTLRALANGYRPALHPSAF